jgi:hypothetical protein
MFLQAGDGRLFGTQPPGKFFLRQPNLFPRLPNQNAHLEFGVALIIAPGKISIPTPAIGNVFFEITHGYLVFQLTYSLTFRKANNSQGGVAGAH